MIFIYSIALPLFTLCPTYLPCRAFYYIYSSVIRLDYGFYLLLPHRSPLTYTPPLPSLIYFDHYAFGLLHFFTVVTLPTRYYHTLFVPTVGCVLVDSLLPHSLKGCDIVGGVLDDDLPTT